MRKDRLPHQLSQIQAAALGLSGSHNTLYKTFRLIRLWDVVSSSAVAAVSPQAKLGLPIRRETQEGLDLSQGCLDLSADGTARIPLHPTQCIEDPLLRHEQMLTTSAANAPSS